MPLYYYLISVTAPVMPYLVDPVVDWVELTGWWLCSEGPVAVGPLLLLTHHHVLLLLGGYSVMS